MTTTPENLEKALTQLPYVGGGAFSDHVWKVKKALEAIESARLQYEHALEALADELTVNNDADQSWTLEEIETTDLRAWPELMARVRANASKSD